MEFWTTHPALRRSVRSALPDSLVASAFHPKPVVREEADCLRRTLSAAAELAAGRPRSAISGDRDRSRGRNQEHCGHKRSGENAGSLTGRREVGEHGKNPFVVSGGTKTGPLPLTMHRARKRSAAKIDERPYRATSVSGGRVRSLASPRSARPASCLPSTQHAH